MIETGSASGRRGILGLAIVALILVIGGGASLIAYSWVAVNDQEAARETLIVRRALDRAALRTANEAASATSWDEAYDQTLRADGDWLDLHFAGYYRLTFGHQVTLVFDPRGRLTYAARNGVRGVAEKPDTLARTVAPWVAQLQAAELRRRRGLDPIGAGEVGSVIWRPAFVRSEGAIYLVGISTIAPTDGTARGDQPAAVVVSGEILDQAFIKRLEDDLGVVGARIAAESSGGPGAVPLTTPDGQRIGWLCWNVARPGAEVLKRADGTILLVVALLGLTLAALGYRMRWLFARLRVKDEALRASMAELVEARDQAQAGNVAKSQFIANISHEIRTPLNGVLGMSQILEQDDLTPTQRDRVRIITRSGQALLKVLNDVLDISKVEAGKLEIEAAAMDLGRLVEEVCESYAGVAATKGVELSWSLAAGMECAWLGDAARIGQILLNLVSNALKFTEAGAVRVEVFTRDEAVCFGVRDQGIGIPPEKLPYLFEKFSQVDGSATRRFGGTGLGLAISRHLAVLMGGDIEVDSREGEGSSFILALPLARAGGPMVSPASEAAHAAAAPAPGLRILAAEDNETNRLVLQAMLAPLEAELVLVEDGAAAVQRFAKDCFDLILMDVQMPVMNGLDATRAIRAAERRDGRAPTPIVALTANAMRHQIDEYEAAGMGIHVSKPLQIERLYEAISSALEQSPRYETAVADPSRGAAGA